jgi:hypothetical protein
VNPFVKTYIDQINPLVAELSKTLEEYERRLQVVQESKEKKVKEFWMATSRVSALEQTLGRLPALEDENDQLREQNRKSLEHAHHILELAKTLSGAMKP